MIWESLGFFVFAALTLILGAVFAHSRFNPFPPRLLLLGLFMRIVGSTARFDMIRIFYGSLADAQRYYHSGLDVARRIWSLDPWIFHLDFWLGPGRWWGTPFMEKLTGLVVAFVGPSMRSAYLVFSLLSFTGLYLIALATYRYKPGRGAVRFAAWIWLWPSLWFWPSSIGKEAVTVFAMGLATYGYLSRGRGISWVPFLSGIGLAFALRPHVGAVLALAAITAHWLQSWTRIGPRRLLEGAVALVVGYFVLSGMAAQFGFANADLEGMQEFVSYRTSQTLEGGSAIGATPGGILAIPVAYVNIWMRPFPWDVHNLMAMFSALEILVLWAVAFHRRRAVAFALRHWRKSRLLAFALPLLAGYSLMIGFTFANLGIIARQRSPLYPFVFLLLSAAGTYVGGRSGRPVPEEVPPRRRPPLTEAAASTRGVG